MSVKEDHAEGITWGRGGVDVCGGPGGWTEMKGWTKSVLTSPALEYGIFILYEKEQNLDEAG